MAYFILLTLSAIASAQADIYVYLDSQGVLHFTNAPTSSNYKIYLRERPKKTGAWRDIASYDDVIEEAARRTGVASSLIKAMIHVESYFNPRAVSKKGAMGLMQIMPENFDALNVTNPFDPWENIMGGARYLRAMLDRFDGQLPLALAAYNAGPKAVERHNDIPPYEETKTYVKRVMKYFRLYKKG